MTKIPKELKETVREWLGTRHGWDMAFPGNKDVDIHFDKFAEDACICANPGGIIRHCHLKHRGKCSVYDAKIKITFDIFDWLVRGVSKTEITDRVARKCAIHCKLGGGE